MPCLNVSCIETHTRMELDLFFFFQQEDCSTIVSFSVLFFCGGNYCLNPKRIAIIGPKIAKIGNSVNGPFWLPFGSIVHDYFLVPFFEDLRNPKEKNK